jgi:hypothetical protein
MSSCQNEADIKLLRFYINKWKAEEAQEKERQEAQGNKQRKYVPMKKTGPKWGV